MLAPWKKIYDQPRQLIKKQRHYFAIKGPSSQRYGFSSSCVWCESWALKKVECRRIDAFKLWCCRRLESPLDCKEIQQVHSKGNQSWIFWKVWCWSWRSNILATWCEELTRLKRPWCWERLRAGGEGDDRGWNGWMASPTQWRREVKSLSHVWLFATLWTVVYQAPLSMGSQGVGHNLAIEQQQRDRKQNKTKPDIEIAPLLNTVHGQSA